MTREDIVGKEEAMKGKITKEDPEAGREEARNESEGGVGREIGAAVIGTGGGEGRDLGVGAGTGPGIVEEQEVRGEDHKIVRAVKTVELGEKET